MNVTLMKAREAHLFPLFNPVAFNSQQTFIPINFLQVYLSQSVLSREANCYIKVLSHLLLQNLISHCPRQAALTPAKLFCLLPCSSVNSVLVHCLLCLNLLSLSLGFSTPTIFKARQDPLPKAFPKHCILQCLHS